MLVDGGFLVQPYARYKVVKNVFWFVFVTNITLKFCGMNWWATIDRFDGWGDVANGRFENIWIQVVFRGNGALEMGGFKHLTF